MDEDQRAGGDGEADDLAGRGQSLEHERRLAELRHHPADHDLQPDHAATAANTLFSALLPWASPALAISPYMKARKARLRALSASWASRL